MKKKYVLFFVLILIGVSCAKVTKISDKDKKIVEAEILAFMDSVEASLEKPSPDKYFNYFLHTGELAVATQGQLITNLQALHDTINKHLAMTEGQKITTKAQKIYVVNNEAVVLSAAQVSEITFKNGARITYPYALTMLIVKREDKWKIAQIHN